MNDRPDSEVFTLLLPLPPLATQISTDLVMFETETAAGPFIGGHPVDDEGRPRQCILNWRDTGLSVKVVMSHELDTCTMAGAATRPGGPLKKVGIRNPQRSLWARTMRSQPPQGYITEGEVTRADED